MGMVLAYIMAVIGVVGVLYMLIMWQKHSRMTGSIVIGIGLLLMVSSTLLLVGQNKSKKISEGALAYEEKEKRKPLVPLEVEFDDEDEEENFEEYIGELDEDKVGLGGLTSGRKEKKDKKPESNEKETESATEPVEKGSENHEGKEEVKPSPSVPQVNGGKDEPGKDVGDTKPNPPTGGTEGNGKLPEDGDDKETLPDTDGSGGGGISSEDNGEEDKEEESPDEDRDEGSVEDNTVEDISKGINEYRNRYVGELRKLVGLSRGNGDYETKKASMKKVEGNLNSIYGEYKVYRGKVSSPEDKKKYDTVREIMNLANIKAGRAVAEYSEDTESKGNSYESLVEESIWLMS